MIDYSTILDFDWFDEIEITKDFGECEDDLYLPIDYEEFGDTLYSNGFLGNEIESLFLDLDSGEYILRIAQSVPIGDYGFRWVYSWLKSKKEKTDDIKKALTYYLEMEI